MALIVGADCGNGDVKLVASGTTLHYRNTLVELTDSRSNNTIKFTSQKVFEYRGRKFYVGVPMARGTLNLNEDRYKSERFKLSMLFAIAQVVKDLEEVYVVTGVPSDEAEDENILNDIKTALFGEHKVIVDGELKQFTVTKIKIVAQPMGTLFSHIFDLAGNSKYEVEQIMKEKFLIVDGGNGTTDMIELSMVGVDKVFSILLGSVHINANIKQMVNKQYPNCGINKEIESIHQLDDKIKGSNVLQLNSGKQYDITQIKTKAYMDYAQEVKDTLSENGFVFKRYTKIIATGGTMINAFQHFKRAFNNDPKVILAPQSHISNALGFYIIGGLSYNELG